jgi:lipoprotein-anchoring transpeptidase ErfK/SrfK
MNSDLTEAIQAIRNSSQALHQGDRQRARYWAQRAVALAPQLEEAWLALAGVSTPSASIEYLQRALAINPVSRQARNGLVWAKNRLAAQDAPLREPPAGAKPGPFYRLKMGLMGFILITMGFAVLFVAAWLVWPEGRSTAEALVLADTATPSPRGYYPVVASPTMRTFPTASPTSPVPAPTQGPRPTADRAEFFYAHPGRLATATPAPVAPSTDERIVVDISEQHMYAYAGDQLVYSFVASTGRGGGTLRGDFRILDKIDNAYSQPWGFWMPNWLGIYYVGVDLENGIHSLPVMPDGEVVWGDDIGKPISYGCVVLKPEDAVLLYNWVEVGTPVEIRD